jgi:hypothetical protein
MFITISLISTWKTTACILCTCKQQCCQLTSTETWSHVAQAPVHSLADLLYRALGMLMTRAYNYGWTQRLISGSKKLLSSSQMVRVYTRSISLSAAYLITMSYSFIKVNISHVPIIWQDAIIFTCYSVASFIRRFFILKANQVLISYTRELASGCTILYYMPNAQLCNQPHLVPHTEHTQSQLQNLFSCLSTWEPQHTGNHGRWGMTHSCT